MYDIILELYNTFLDEYFDECNDLKKEKKKSWPLILSISI